MIKETRLADVTLYEEEDKMILEGYALVFNNETLIGDEEYGFLEEISFMYRIAAQKEIEKGLLCELAIEDFNESREFNFVYLKNCADESLYKKWYNKFFL